MSCFALHLFWFSVCFSLLHLHVSCFSVHVPCVSVLCYLLSYCLWLFSGDCFFCCFFLCCFLLISWFVSEGIVSSYIILSVFLLVRLSFSVDFMLKRLLGFSVLVVFYLSCGAILGGDGMVGWLFV